MTIKQAKENLIIYRQQQKKLRQEIDALREFLRSKGIDPDPKVDLTKRNKAMYRRHLNGFSYVEIGKRYDLSAARVRGICKRIEFIKKDKIKLP